MMQLTIFEQIFVIDEAENTLILSKLNPLPDDVDELESCKFVWD